MPPRAHDWLEIIVGRGYSLAFAATVSTTAMFCSNSDGTLCRSCKYAGLLRAWFRSRDLADRVIDPRAERDGSATQFVAESPISLIGTPIESGSLSDPDAGSFF
jgi:hypothetical protein